MWVSTMNLPNVHKVMTDDVNCIPSITSAMLLLLTHRVDPHQEGGFVCNRKDRHITVL